MKRYLAFTTSEVKSITKYLKQQGCSDIILRKFTQGTEIDFHCKDTEILIQLNERFYFERLQELDEESDAYSPEKRQGFLDAEASIVKEANGLIAEERFWESHTLLENLWKSHEGETKQYYQGVILVLASMAQYQMGNNESALSLYERAKKLLDESEKGQNILKQIPETFAYPVFFEI